MFAYKLRNHFLFQLTYYNRYKHFIFRCLVKGRISCGVEQYFNILLDAIRPY